MILRLQNNVPEPYIEQSRDFQLIAHAYDCIINGVKSDIDSMIYAINTEECSDNILRLLQTKLGFFTNKEFSNDDLRYILRAFPVIVKNKGSLLAIKQAVRVFMKVRHITNPTIIEITDWQDETEPNMVRIKIGSSVTDTALLDEVLKYVLPTGYGVTYQFYSNINNENEPPMELSTTGIAFYVSDTINSAVRNSDISETTEENRAKNRIMGAVGDMEVISSDSDGNTTNVIETYEE